MAGKYNFSIEQNSDFHRVITWKDEAGTAINLTGATATLIARNEETDTTPALNLTHTSGLVLGGAAGTITISLDDTDTAALNFNTARYTLKVNDTILLRGLVSLKKDKTS